MKILCLTQGFIALISDEDYPELSKYKWHTLKSGRQRCAVRNSPRVKGKQCSILMHREIMGMRPGLEIDHITHEGEEDGVIDNRRENLRFCTRSQNNANARKRAGCTSRFKGVSWDKRAQRWQGYICANGKKKFLGYFGTEEEAARAYDKAAREIWGERANLNFPL